MFTNKSDFIKANENDFTAEFLDSLFYAHDDQIGNDTYICDYISEFADDHTSIYYCDILDFIKSDPEALADVVAEGLYEVRPGAEYDLYKHGQAAEYFRIEQNIYENKAEYVAAALIQFIDIQNRRAHFPEMTDDEARALYQLVDRQLTDWDDFDDVLNFTSEYIAEVNENRKGA